MISSRIINDQPNNYNNPVNTRRYLDVVATSFGRCGRQMDVKTMLDAYCNPVNTRRHLDVVSTSFGRYGRQMDVETTTLCAYTGNDMTNRT